MRQLKEAFRDCLENTKNLLVSSRMKAYCAEPGISRSPPADGTL